MTEVTETTQSFSFDNLLNSVNELSQSLSTIKSDVKKLESDYQRTLKKTQKQNSKRKFTEKPKTPSKALSSFMKLSEETTTRSEAIRSVCSYVKEKNLQCENNRRNFTVDKTLKKLFSDSLNGRKELSFLDVNSLLRTHLS
tara:strand:+ start:3130 stop:3552 length:423 start_codon:yes stop_codon:yes gene_type:complete